MRDERLAALYHETRDPAHLDALTVRHRDRLRGFVGRYAPALSADAVADTAIQQLRNRLLCSRVVPNVQVFLYQTARQLAR